MSRDFDAETELECGAYVCDDGGAAATAKVRRGDAEAR